MTRNPIDPGSVELLLASPYLFGAPNRAAQRPDLRYTLAGRDCSTYG